MFSVITFKTSGRHKHYAGLIREFLDSTGFHGVDNRKSRNYRKEEQKFGVPANFALSFWTDNTFR